MHMCMCLYVYMVTILACSCIDELVCMMTMHNDNVKEFEHVCCYNYIFLHIQLLHYVYDYLV